MNFLRRSFSLGLAIDSLKYPYHIYNFATQVSTACFEPDQHALVSCGRVLNHYAFLAVVFASGDFKLGFTHLLTVIAPPRLHE